MGWKRALASFRGRQEHSGGAVPDEVVRARAAKASRDWPAAATAWEAVADLPAADDLGAEPFVELGRARRLTRDLTGATEAVDRGLARHPDDLGLLVEAARTALRGYAVSAEDQRHVWKARLLDAEAGLRRARARGEASKPALQAAGEIELVLRRWDDAIALWQELERRYPDRRDEAIVKQATALRTSGDLEAARRMLDRVSPEAAASDEASRLAQAITANERVAAANETFSAASARWHAGEPGVLRAQMPTAIADRGHPDARVARVLPFLDDLSAFLDAAAGAPSTGPCTIDAADAGIGQERDIVAVSGFLYSGSGAVFDLLRTRPAFHLPFAEKETGFLKKPGHLATILEEPGPGRFPDPATVADVLLASTVGFGQSGRPLLGWAARDDAAVDTLVGQLRWLVAELHRTWAELGHDRAAAEPATVTALRRFTDAVIAERTPADRRALLNNAIVGHQLDRLHLLSRAVAVAVLRDPRDQYVSQRLESPFALDCETFTETMADRYRAYRELLADPTLADQLVTVSFEPFVTDADVRAALLDRLEVDGGVVEGATAAFDPSRSQRNVGIHRGYGDQTEIAHVEAALLESYTELVNAV